MKSQSSRTARSYFVLAAALFEALAAYTFLHDRAQWPEVVLWAAIGAMFLALGLAKSRG